MCHVLILYRISECFWTKQREGYYGEGQCAHLQELETHPDPATAFQFHTEREREVGRRRKGQMMPTAFQFHTGREREVGRRSKGADDDAWAWTQAEARVWTLKFDNSGFDALFSSHYDMWLPVFC